MTCHQPAKSPARQLTRRPGPASAGMLAAAIVASSLVFPAPGVQAQRDASKVPGPLHSQRSAPNLLHDTRDPQKFWTTPDGPQYANIIIESTNFLPCRGGPFALCYYSGPAPFPCTIDEDGRFATCKCLDVTYGNYYVDINAILDHAVYQQTVKVCSVDGSGCSCPEKDDDGKCIPAPVNTAPVCNYINQQKLIPGADRISTFSFDCAAEAPIGQTQCEPGTYAGCMTAPCQETGEEGTVACRCPLYDGPFEVGMDNQMCSLTDPPRVWSAAHAVTASDSGSGEQLTTFPTLDVSACIPDLTDNPTGARCCRRDRFRRNRPTRSATRSATSTRSAYRWGSRSASRATRCCAPTAVPATISSPTAAAGSAAATRPPSSNSRRRWGAAAARARSAAATRTRPHRRRSPS
jgi:hypothetical protein